jgi:hypothetical protein
MFYILKRSVFLHDGVPNLQKYILVPLPEPAIFGSLPTSKAFVKNQT